MSELRRFFPASPTHGPEAVAISSPAVNRAPHNPPVLPSPASDVSTNSASSTSSTELRGFSPPITPCGSPHFTFQRAPERFMHPMTPLGVSAYHLVEHKLPSASSEGRSLPLTTVSLTEWENLSLLRSTRQATTVSKTATTSAESASAPSASAASSRNR